MLRMDKKRLTVNLESQWLQLEISQWPLGSIGIHLAVRGGTGNSRFLAGWWFGTCFIFPYIGLLIIPIDFHIFQRGGPTTNQKISRYF